MNDTVQIPEHILTVTPEEQSRLADKKFQAMAWLYDNPFAKAMHFKLKARLKRQAAVVTIW